DRGGRDHGGTPPQPRRRGRAVSSRKRADAGRAAAARELPARARRRRPLNEDEPMNDIATSPGIDAVRALERVASGSDLGEAEADALLEAMASAEIAPTLAGAMLIALRCKGECAAEIRGFANAMRRLARRPSVPEGGRYV